MAHAVQFHSFRCWLSASCAWPENAQAAHLHGSLRLHLFAERQWGSRRTQQIHIHDQLHLGGIPQALHAVSPLHAERVVFHDVTQKGNTISGDCVLSYCLCMQDADSTDVYTISRTWADLVKRARAKQLQPSEYNSLTFTVSNLGMFGADQFDAILPPGALASSDGREVLQLWRWVCHLASPVGMGSLVAHLEKCQQAILQQAARQEQ